MCLLRRQSLGVKESGNNGGGKGKGGEIGVGIMNVRKKLYHELLCKSWCSNEVLNKQTNKQIKGLEGAVLVTKNSMKENIGKAKRTLSSVLVFKKTA